MSTYNVDYDQDDKNKQYLIQAFISGIPDYMNNTLELIANNPTLVSPSIIDAIAFRVPIIHHVYTHCSLIVGLMEC